MNSKEKETDWKDWWVNWDILCSTFHFMLHRCSIIPNCSICFSVLFVSLLQTVAGVYWNHKQCFDNTDYCEIITGRKCCEPPLYVGALVCHPKEAIRKNRTLRSKHSYLKWHMQANFPVLVFSKNSAQYSVRFVEGNTPLWCSYYILILSHNNYHN